MKKTLHAILILTLTAAVFGAEEQNIAPKKPPVRTLTAINDGFFIDGVEGRLVKEPDAAIWSFLPDKTIEEDEGKTIAAGRPVLMLPCAVLEQMTALAGQENQLYIRLWAMFTKYKHANYLYSVYFLPIRDEANVPPQTSPAVEPVRENSDEPVKKETPEEESIIPKEILAQIKSTRTPDLKRFQQIAQVTGDTNLIGRTGYLVEQNGNCMFQPDGFGLKIDGRPLFLLPNEARQAAERQMGQTPGRQRYNVSGLLTTCNGQTYLLLRRATRTFTHGNFTP